MNKPGHVFRTGRTLFLQQPLVRDGRVVGFSWDYAPPGVYVSQNPQSRFPRLIVPTEPAKELTMAETVATTPSMILPDLLQGAEGYGSLIVLKKTAQGNHSVCILDQWGEMSTESELDLLTRHHAEQGYYLQKAKESAGVPLEPPPTT